MSVERITLFAPQHALSSIWNCKVQNHEPPPNGPGPHYPWFINVPYGFKPDDYEYHREFKREDLYRKRKGAWKDFDHYKAFRASSTPGVVTLLGYVDGTRYHCFSGDFVNGRVGCTAPENGQVSPFGEPGMPVQDMHDSFYVDQADGSFVPVPLGLDEFIQRGLKTMLPEVKQKLSLINSLIELKDFKSLPRTVKNVLDQFRGVFTPRGKATLRSLLHGGADGYLQTQFNIKPLLSDIAGIQSALATLQSDVCRLLSEAGKPRVHHSIYTWQEYPDGRDLSVNYNPVSIYGDANGDAVPSLISVARMERIVRHNPSVFHMQIEYNYNYSQYQRENAPLLTLLDKVGVNFDPKIIWNAIPWSFVIDWVVNVSSFLDQFKVQHMDPQINIRNCLWSVKRSRDLYFEKTISHPDPDFTWPSQTTSLPAVKETSYKRRIFTPSLSQLTVGGLSSNEVTLGAALVLSRKWRRTKRQWR